MEIKVLGSKGEIEESLPYHSKKSGILIDKKLLLDVGEKEFLQYKPKWILITHFHPDHAYFVRRGKQEIFETNAKVFVPEPLQPGMIVLNKKRKIGPYTVTPIPTIHSKYVKSQGYLIEKGKQAIFYSSDLIWVEKKYHTLLKNLDLVITEASFMKKGGMVRRDGDLIYGHNGVPDLIRLFSRFTDTIVLTHFGSWFYKNTKKSRKALAALGKKYGVQVIPAYDGLEV